MKKMKRLLSAFLVLCMIAAMIPLTARAATGGNCGDDVAWSLNSGVLTISGTGPMDNYGEHYYEYIEGERYNAYDYETNVAPWYAYSDSIEKIVIQNGVTTIGDGAFFDLYLVTDVTIADTVTSIGTWAFRSIDHLSTVTIPDSVTTINSGAFSFCREMTSLTIPNSVTTIGEQAFLYCIGLTSVTIPDSVVIIESEAFAECDNLTNISIGSGTAEIHPGAFSCGTSLKRITVSANNPNYRSDSQGFLFSKDRKTLVAAPTGYSGAYTIPNHVTTIGENAFAECRSLTSVTIPNSVTSIGAFAFLDCYRLTSVTLSANVKDIPKGAFSACTALTAFTIPDGVETIGMSAFENCIALGEIVIPASVAFIDNYAFTWCDDLETVTFQGNAPVIAPYAFWFTTTTARYPAGNSTWTSVIEDDYHGNITWVAVKDKPDAPRVSIANVASTGKIKLSWNKVDGAAKYEVYRATSKNGSYSRITTTTSTSITNTKVNAGSTYYYYVRAVADNGRKSDKSNIVSRTCDVARPEVSITNIASSGKIKLSWKKIDGATKYEVYRATSKNGTYTLLKTTTSTSLTNTTVTAGKTYYYKVKAIASKSAANSADSEIVPRTCDLAQPTVSIALSSKKPKVSWKKVSGATKYDVYRATSKAGTYSKVKTTTSLNWKDTTAKSGKTYYYKVVAVASKSAANSAYSGIVSIKSK